KLILKAVVKICDDRVEVILFPRIRDKGLHRGQTSFSRAVILPPNEYAFIRRVPRIADKTSWTKLPSPARQAMGILGRRSRSDWRGFGWRSTGGKRASSSSGSSQPSADGGAAADGRRRFRFSASPTTLRGGATVALSSSG